MRRCPFLLVAAAGATSLLAGCGSGSGSSGVDSGDRLDVVASFYPLQYITERIGGDRVSVTNLTPVGAEPHEIELPASKTVTVADADLVVYLHGFAPAVDEAVTDVAEGRGFDVAPAARLDLQYVPLEEAALGGGDSVPDPHFWLDPDRLASVAAVLAERMAAVDPADAALFEANSARLIADLRALDAEYRAGLAQCASRVIVTSHNAFGYLAERYGLTQVGVTGLAPEDEPSPNDLARVSAYVEEHHVSTIYTETLVSPAIAATVAQETGATTAVLDPLEGLSADESGADYLAIMRSDLATLRTGQGCS